MSRDVVKLLIVDDVEGIVDYSTELFKLRGHKAFGANNGTAAIEIFKKEKPDICLIDILLGAESIDGLEVLQEIKKIEPDAICIMITQITDQDKIDKAKKIGALHYLLKPLNVDDLKEVVEEAVQILTEREKNNG